MDIDRLEIQIIDNSDEAAGGIDKLVASLGRLRSASSGGAGATKIATALERISAAAKGANVGQVAMQVQGLVSALAPLSNLGKNNLTSFLTQLGKIPKVTDGLDSQTLDAFAAGIGRVTTAVQPLANEMEKISMGFSALPRRIQTFINQMERSGQASGTAAQGYRSAANGISTLNQKFNVTVLYAGIRRITNVLSGFVDNANQYVEDINLFTVSMGEFADSAYEYAQRAQDLMGIDAGQFMRNQGFFQSIASGFGVASDQAALMSKNLAQLGYDLASFYNSDVETAMQKLQSGLAGELEPLRRWGFALDQVTLQEIALSLGIQGNIRDMSQAQKSVIRYIAIMQQSANAQHDMARTLETPANAMRILSQQVTLLGRSLGNLLIPALSAILPYAVAATKALRGMLDTITAFFGFTLPSIDYDSFGGLGVGASAAEDIEDALGGAASNAKKMRDYVMGFDELNIIRPDDDSGGGGGAGGISGFENLQLPEYDFLDGLSEQVDALVPAMQRWLKVLLAIGAALAALKLVKFISDLGKLLSALTPVQKGFAGVLAAVVAFGGGFMLGQELFKLFNGELEGFSVNMGIGIAAMVAGTAALGAMFGPVGLIVGAVASLLGVAVGFGEAARQAARLEAVMYAFASNGGTPIQELTSNFIALTDAITAGSSEILKNGETMNVLQGQIEGAQTRVSGLAGALVESMRSGSTESLAVLKEYLPQITAEFETMCSDIQTQLNLAKDTLLLAFGQAPKDLLAELGTDLPELVTMTVEAHTGMSAELQGMMQEFAGLADAIDKGVATDPQISRFEELTAAISSQMGIAKTDIDALMAKVQEVGVIDFSAMIVPGDADTTLANVTAEIDKLNAAGLSALDTVKATYETNMESLKKLIPDESSPEYQQMAQVIEGMFIIDSNKIITAQTAAVSAIKDSFYAKMQEMFPSADADILGQVFGGNFMEAANTAAQAMLQSDFTSVFETIDAAGAGVKTGIEVIEGVVAGFDQKSITAAEQLGYSMKTITDKIEQTMVDSFNSREPRNAFQAFADALVNIFREKFQKPITDALNNTMNTAASSFNSFQFSGGRASYAPVAVPNIPALAGGGVPSVGQLFVANERGPELVGNFGGHTGVMNNGQIVDAVSSGVFDAMLSALSQQYGNGQPIIIQLDGRTVYESTVANQQSYGYAGIQRTAVNLG